MLHISHKQQTHTHMKRKINSLLIVLFLFTSCTTLVKAQTSTKPDPCKDSMLLVLKSKPLDSLSQRQFQYLQDKEKECENASQLESIQAQQSSTTSTLWWIIGVCLVASILIIVL